MPSQPPPDEKVPPPTPNLSYREALPLDIERYRGYLDGMDLSEAQAAEMLRTLWSILSAFVDLGFGVDSVHLARPQVRDEDPESTP